LHNGKYSQYLNKDKSPLENSDINTTLLCNIFDKIEYTNYIMRQSHSKRKIKLPKSIFDIYRKSFKNKAGTKRDNSFKGTVFTPKKLSEFSRIWSDSYNTKK
jgi:hypothetical protein